MPKYRFKCDKCPNETEKFTGLKEITIPCTECDGTLQRQLPTSGTQVAREVVDSFTNTRASPDARKESNDRKTEYFWEVEVPRLVQTYSVQTCLEEGWLVYNDKGELVINKPPSKR